MSESFAQLFEESLKDVDMSPGAIVLAEVVEVTGDWVTVNAGLKSEGLIPVQQFFDDKGDVAVVVGDEVKVALESLEDGFGETRLSREKAKKAEVWVDLEAASSQDKPVIGIINGKVKGGFTVDIQGVRAFLPGSLIDVRPIRDTTHLEGKELEFKVIKLDAKRSNVVVSRRAVLESVNSEERDSLLASLQEGMSVKGIVKNLTDYGAFVDLGGVDGLLHITDMSWKRIKHPSEIVAVGDEINVKILKFDRERSRVSLGLKQLGEDPWMAIKNRYPVNVRVMAKITNLTDYGCFAELEDGVEGLVHVSEMDWTNKNVHPSKIVNVGDEVEVMVLEIDEERRRISLGIKQCQDNPWESFASKFTKGIKVKGQVKSITDFGLFIGLDGSIDGLVHMSDISWTEEGEEAVRQFSKGQEVEAVVLSIDPDRERISLGIKQLDEDPFSNYLAVNEKGSVINATVTEVSAQEAKFELAPEVPAFLKAADFSESHTADLSAVLKVGDEVEAMIVAVDKKTRALQLSVKAKDVEDTKEALKEFKSQEAAPATTLGDLIKEQMDKKS